MTTIYENMHSFYKVSKTLRFELKPVNQTLANIECEGFLERDFNRSQNYKKAKRIIDDYHRWFIDDALSTLTLPELDEYYALFIKANKTDSEKEELENLELSMVKSISEQFEGHEKWATLDKKELISDELPSFMRNEGYYSNLNNAYSAEEFDIIKSFDKFTTYFTGFHENRKNIYSGEGKSTEVAYRIVYDNLPTFIQNMIIFEKNKELITNLADTDFIKDTFGNLEDIFSIAHFNRILTQKGIDDFNALLGGISTETIKYQGLNELINLHSQQHPEIRLPKMTQLKKQILSDVESHGFSIDIIDDDIELVNTVKEFNDLLENFCFTENQLSELFQSIGKYDMDHIYIRNNPYYTNLFQKVYGDWHIARGIIEQNYPGSDEEQLRKVIKSTRQLSYNSLLNNIDKYGLDASAVTLFVNNLGSNDSNAVDLIRHSYKELETIFDLAHHNRAFLSNNKIIALFKNYLDSVKNLEDFMKWFDPIEKDVQLDNNFYGAMSEFMEVMSMSTKVYNCVRNYLTQKPYSEEKYKLNFDRPTLADGWDVNKEKDNLAVLFKKDNKYYLGIMNKSDPGVLSKIDSSKESGDCYQKVEYKLLPGPNKMLPKVFLSSKKGCETYHPSVELQAKYKKGLHKKGKDFDLAFCHELIDYFKSCIAIHPDYKNFGFNFSDTSSYNDISEFYKEVEQQGYMISYRNISKETIDTLIYENKLFMFQLYNKDFSDYSKGTKNLHTLYWEAIFAPENKERIVYQLNGGAELFYRPASLEIEKVARHEANQPIKNKNDLNDKEYSTFSYTIYKNKRYTEDKFFLHVPVSMNFKNKGINNLNDEVRTAVHKADKINIMGIDRGERNLLYVVIINENGEILVQESLNEIVNSYNGKQHKIDYHSLLDKKEKERELARENWTSIENIKELKEGYLSAVINRIIQLVDEYHPLIVLEDLNSGFKNSRTKFEKQVYQKFEKALIDKLNYLVIKSKNPAEIGGLFNPYQLTNKFESFTRLGKQSGVLFYVPAQNTSKIDPVTGFINQLYPKYESVERSQQFFRNFTDIRYNNTENYYEFHLDYRKFKGSEYSAKPEWTICTYGTRLVNKRNEQGNWITEEVNLTESLTSLFEDYQIDTNDLYKSICDQDNKRFFESMMYLLKLTLSIRNSRTGTSEDYLISPVRDDNGEIFDSRKAPASLPKDADANGAYNIARKGLMCVKDIKSADPADLRKIKFNLKLEDFLDFVQHD